MKNSIFIVPLITLCILTVGCSEHRTGSGAPISDSVNGASCTLPVNGDINFLINSSIKWHEYVFDPNRDGTGPMVKYRCQIDSTSGGQNPYVFVLSCIDSRVPPEIILGQGIGYVFSGRTAGAIEDSAILGSMEYAVSIMNVKTIVVLGHTRCGAIAAAYKLAQNPGDTMGLPVNLRKLVQHISSSGIIIPDKQPDYYSSSVQTSEKTIEHILSKSKAIKDSVNGGNVKIYPAVYNVETGSVDWLKH
jgi:carbonic anhydrase